MHSDRLISSWLPHFSPFITSHNPTTRGKAKIKGEQQAKFLKLSRNVRVSSGAIWRRKCSRSNTRFYENTFASSASVEIDYQYLHKTCLYCVPPFYHQSLILYMTCYIFMFLFMEKHVLNIKYTKAAAFIKYIWCIFDIWAIIFRPFIDSILGHKHFMKLVFP